MKWKKKNDTETFSTLIYKIKVSLSNFQKDLKTSKSKKYERDTNDYAERTVCDQHGEKKRFLKPHSFY